MDRGGEWRLTAFDKEKRKMEYHQSTFAQPIHESYTEIILEVDQQKPRDKTWTKEKYSAHDLDQVRTCEIHWRGQVVRQRLDPSFNGYRHPIGRTVPRTPYNTNATKENAYIWKWHAGGVQDF